MKEMEADQERMRASRDALKSINDSLSELIQKSISTQDAIQPEYEPDPFTDFGIGGRMAINCISTQQVSGVSPNAGVSANGGASTRACRTPSARRRIKGITPRGPR